MAGMSGSALYVAAAAAVLLAAVGVQSDDTCPAGCNCDKTHEITCNSSYTGTLKELVERQDITRITLNGVAIDGIKKDDTASGEALTDLSIISPTGDDFTVEPDSLQTLTSLTSLNLTHTKLASIPNLDVPTLTSVDLSSNKIEKVKAGVVTANLQDLWLNKNPISTVEQLVIDGTENVKLVTLLMSGLGITGLGADVFKGLDGLKTLDLSENEHLHALNPTTFPAFSAQPKVLLNNCTFNAVPTEALKGKEISELHMNSNKIATLKSDNFNECSIHKLYMNNNTMTSVEANALNGLSDIDTMELKDNSLTSLPDDFIKGLTTLETLDLASNELNEVPSNIGFENLKTLCLDSNNIKDLKNKPFEKATKLESLSLSKGVLTTMAEGSLTGLDGLTSLSITDNKDFKQCADFTFSKMNNLNLENNAIETFHAGWFANDEMATANIKGNNLKCDCNAAWIQEKLNKDPLPKWIDDSWKELSCSLPENLKGTTVKNIRKEDFTCTNVTSLIFNRTLASSAGQHIHIEVQVIGGLPDTKWKIPGNKYKDWISPKSQKNLWETHAEENKYTESGNVLARLYVDLDEGDSGYGTYNLSVANAGGESIFPLDVKSGVGPTPTPCDECNKTGLKVGIAMLCLIIVFGAFGVFCWCRRMRRGSSSYRNMESASVA